MAVEPLPLGLLAVGDDLVGDRMAARVAEHEALDDGGVGLEGESRSRAKLVGKALSILTYHARTA